VAPCLTGPAPGALRLVPPRSWVPRIVPYRRGWLCFELYVFSLDVFARCFARYFCSMFCSVFLLDVLLDAFSIFLLDVCSMLFWLMFLSDDRPDPGCSIILGLPISHTIITFQKLAGTGYRQITFEIRIGSGHPPP
jgi:hypothetical protein